MAKEYTVITNVDINQLISRVNAALAEGWELCGNFVVELQRYRLYHQPMQR